MIIKKINLENTYQNSASSPRVSIIILNYNGWKDTLECLESVLKIDYPTFQVVVVDNASTDGSMQRLEEWADGKIPANASMHSSISRLTSPPVPKPISYCAYEGEVISKHTCGGDSSKLTFIKSGTNGGFAAGNNLGIKFAQSQQDCQFVWLLNNDTVVHPNSLKELLKYYAASAGKLGILGSKLLYYHNPDLIQALGGQYNKWLCSTRHIGSYKNAASYTSTSMPDITPDYVIGAAMFVPTSFILDVGLINEEYFLYFEELDWSIRGKKKGWSIDVCLESTVYHKEGASISANDSKSELADYYSLKNRILFTRRFFPIALPSVYLSLLFVAFNRLRRGQPERLKLIIKALKGK